MTKGWKRPRELEARELAVTIYRGKDVPLRTPGVILTESQRVTINRIISRYNSDHPEEAAITLLELGTPASGCCVALRELRKERLNQVLVNRNEKTRTRTRVDYAEEDEHLFATLDHCVKYINQALVAYGFPAPLELGSQDPVAVARTCNCLFAILQQRQHDVAFRESSNDQRQRLASDISRLESKVERLEASLAAKEKELVTMMSKEQNLVSSFKAQTEKLQQERDEFQRMVIGAQQVKSQQLHEMRKKEKELTKLQERLNQVLADRKKETRTGMEIMSLLQKESRQRGTWNGKKADGDFVKMIVDTYEVKKQELITENAELKALLRSMQTDMRDFLNNSQSSCYGERPVSPLGGRTDVFDLPFHIARDQIQESLRGKMTAIKEHLSNFQEAEKGMQLVTETSDRELELEAQLVEARSIIEEQAAVMNKRITRPQSYTEASDDSELSESLETNCSLLERMSQQLDEQCLELSKTKERLQEEQSNRNARPSSWNSQTGSPGKVLNACGGCEPCLVR